MKLRFDAKCGVCDYVFDDCTLPEDPTQQPKTGDLSVCLVCGELAIFQVSPWGVTLRDITQEERVSALADEHVAHLLTMRRRQQDASPNWFRRN